MFPLAGQAEGATRTGPEVSAAVTGPVHPLHLHVSHSAIEAYIGGRPD